MMKSFSLSVLLLVFPYQDLVQAWTTALPAQQPLNATLASFDSRLGFLQRRQNAAKPATCGFIDGRADKPRTADPGFDCRVDTRNALWGFCPTTVLAAVDCGLAGACFDSHGCSDGCGISADPRVTTFTCMAAGGDYCSTAILTAGPDQTYSYIACANSPITDHLLAAATTTPVKAVPTPSPSPSPAETSRIKITESQTPAPTPSSSDLSTSSSSSPSSPSSSSAGTTEAITSPPSTTPPQPTLSPSSTDSASSPSTPAASSTAPNNIGAIVGGAIGGAALICFVVLGVMLLRRYQRNHDPPKAPEAAEAHFPYERETHSDQRFMAPYSKRYTPFEMPTQKHNSPFELHSEKVHNQRFELSS